MARIVKGAIPSPNIWNTPEVYELENRAVDPEGVADAAMRAVRSWDGGVVLDIGCGTGFHLPGYAATAREVVGVEPHPGLARQAAERCRTTPNVVVRTATAQDLPLPDASVDVAVARWAYFFGPGCEPGLRELARVVRKGGAAFVVDLDGSRGAFGRWFTRTVPSYSTERVEAFWTRQGWMRRELDLRMVFTARSHLEAVLRIEFAPEVAEEAVAATPGLEIDYPNVLRWRLF
ncbi:class I SAM-dependent methyltransferase [Sphaerisporangium rubeum]|uniref:Ubiquinone/menaquinone biosynthesis C-methylase UbiE n=1 Tax=Sphaerisporangium rubeum TaxID=321317 RepID=A0A7X0M9T4_9ACTN|nr:class I SAM-dependent methyltransferase [Sphaerisporangium rubeum]MBB6476807.1 ubiquinone/menaquinone biosynthesis C-methylase UbiE [Sphaerisporangium rubeum]